MTDLGLDTTKDAALRLCAQMVEERDAAVNLLRDLTAFGIDEVRERRNEAHRQAVALLARLDGRTG